MAKRRLISIVLLFIMFKFVSVKSQTNHPTCRSSTFQDIYKYSCTNNSTPLVKMFVENLYVHETETIIDIYCYSDDPLILTSNLLPKKHITKRPNISFDSCGFPADETITKILNESLTIFKTEKLFFKNEYNDNFLTRTNLKGLGNTIELSFYFQDLSTLPKDLFEDLTELKNLRISSKNSELLPAIFDSLVNLETLNLEENNLQDISAGIFAHQRNLRKLVLFRNNLTNLKKDAFEGLFSLSTLDLGWNDIQTFQSAVFSHLRNLSEIVLDENRFRSLPSDLFATNRKLTTFSLTKNRGALRYLPKGLLRDLPLLNKVAINCQLECISSDLFANSPAIKKIYIFGNKLQDVMPLRLFEYQVELNELDLTGNQIKELINGLFNNTRKLTSLNLSNNRLTFLKGAIFQSLTKLKVLNLENNQLLATSGNPILNILMNRSKDLININLRNNKITFIDCNVIQNLTSIIIDLNENPLHCDCNIICLIQKIKTNHRPYTDLLRCGTPSILQGRKLTEVNPNELICPLDRQENSFLSQCSNKCSYGIRPYDSVLVIHCSDENLHNIPAPPTFDQAFSNGTELFIEHNLLIEFTSNTLQMYENITLFSIIQKNPIANSTLTEGYLSNLPKLKKVHLDLQLEELSENLFLNSTSITNLTISGTSLRELPQNIFKDQKRLISIDLSRNKLVKLKENGFSSNCRLQMLRLSHNLLTSLEASMFYNLSNLKYIYLDNNKLQDVSPMAFDHARGLTFINMENNNISSIEPFSRLYDTLETLILRNNSIGNNIYEYIQQLPLTYLDLSLNSINIIDLSGLANMKNPVKFSFSNNHIRTIKLENTQSNLGNVQKADFGGNPINCDCNILSFVRLLKTQSNQSRKDFHFQINFYDSIKDLQCSSPDYLKDRLVNTLSLEDLVCPVNSSCPKRCKCWNRPFDSVLVVNCSNSDLTVVPSVIYLETSLIPNPKSGYKNQNTSTVDVILDLSFNQLEKLDEKTLRVWNESRNLRSVFLRNNRWICDCSSEKLHQLIMLKQSLFPDLEKIQCENGQVFRSLIYSNICSNNTATVIGVTIGVIGIVLVLIAYLYYTNREYILVWMFSRGICLGWVTEEEVDRNKTYDAFVSYSGQDTQFILDELIPKLENGPIPYKLCLHDRDWIVGGYIPDQIVNSVANSKRTIVVMSSNYINSSWARLEFRTAHKASLNEKRARVIVILLGDVGEIENLDSDLQQYMKMYTYLKWGHPLFWERIYYAMPHPLRKNQKINELRTSLI